MAEGRGSDPVGDSSDGGSSTATLNLIVNQLLQDDEVLSQLTSSLRAAPAVPTSADVLPGLGTTSADAWVTIQPGGGEPLSVGRPQVALPPSHGPPLGQSSSQVQHQPSQFEQQQQWQHLPPQTQALGHHQHGQLMHPQDQQLVQLSHQVSQQSQHTIQQQQHIPPQHVSQQIQQPQYQPQQPQLIEQRQAHQLLAQAQQIHEQQQQPLPRQTQNITLQIPQQRQQFPQQEFRIPKHGHPSHIQGQPTTFQHLQQEQQLPTLQDSQQSSCSTSYDSQAMQMVVHPGPSHGTCSLPGGREVVHPELTQQQHVGWTGSVADQPLQSNIASLDTPGLGTSHQGYSTQLQSTGDMSFHPQYSSIPQRQGSEDLQSSWLHVEPGSTETLRHSAQHSSTCLGQATDIHSSLPVDTTSGMSTIAEDVLNNVLRSDQPLGAQGSGIAGEALNTQDQAMGAPMGQKLFPVESTTIHHARSHTQQDVQASSCLPPQHQSIVESSTMSSMLSSFQPGTATSMVHRVPNPARALMQECVVTSHSSQPSSSTGSVPRQTTQTGQTPTSYSHLKALRGTIVQYAMPDSPAFVPAAQRPQQNPTMLPQSPAIMTQASGSAAKPISGRSTSPKVFLFPPQQSTLTGTSTQSPNVPLQSPLTSPSSAESLSLLHHARISQRCGEGSPAPKELRLMGGDQLPKRISSRGPHPGQAGRISGESSPNLPPSKFRGRPKRTSQSGEAPPAPKMSRDRKISTSRLSGEASPAAKTRHSESQSSPFSSASRLSGEQSPVEQLSRQTGSVHSPLPSTSRLAGDTSPAAPRLSTTSKPAAGEPSPVSAQRVGISQVSSASRLSSDTSPAGPKATIGHGISQVSSASRLSSDASPAAPKATIGQRPLSSEASPSAGASWTSSEPSPGASVSVREKLSQAIRRRHGSLSGEDQEDSSQQHSKRQLTPHELAKKERRREQNRRAAQKCRQKKKDAADTVVQEYRKLQASNTSLRQEIRSLSQERDQLTQLLDEHRSSCPLTSSESGPRNEAMEGASASLDVAMETESEEESDTTTNEADDDDDDDEEEEEDEEEDS